MATVQHVFSTHWHLAAYGLSPGRRHPWWPILDLAIVQKAHCKSHWFVPSPCQPTGYLYPRAGGRSIWLFKGEFYLQLAVSVGDVVPLQGMGSLSCRQGSHHVQSNLEAKLDFTIHRLSSKISSHNFHYPRAGLECVLKRSKTLIFKRLIALFIAFVSFELECRLYSLPPAMCICMKLDFIHYNFWLGFFHFYSSYMWSPVSSLWLYVNTQQMLQN